MIVTREFMIHIGYEKTSAPALNVDFWVKKRGSVLDNDFRFAVPRKKNVSLVNLRPLPNTVVELLDVIVSIEKRKSFTSGEENKASRILFELGVSDI